MATLDIWKAFATVNHGRLFHLIDAAIYAIHSLGITPCSDTKILEVTFDPLLTFSRNTNYFKNMMQVRNKETLTKKPICRPISTYAAPILTLQDKPAIDP